MDNIDINDLFNLDLDVDSIFEGDGDDLFSAGHDQDYALALAADVTAVGFGSNNNDNNNAVGGAFASATTRADAEPPLFAVGGGNNQQQQVNNNNTLTSAEEADGPPQLIIAKPNGTCVYRSDTLGIKVIDISNNSPAALSQSIAKLAHEDRISKFLPPTVNKRQVVEISSFHGSPALYFKWENGITCDEWLDKVKSQRNQQGAVEFNVRLRAAMAIAKTLCQFHLSRVVYNSLVLENIVLTPFEGDYLATFIDLSDADICESKEVFEMRKGGDLVSLGIILNHLFRGDVGASRRSSSLAAAAAPGGGAQIMMPPRQVSLGSDVDGGEVADTNSGRNVRKRGKQLKPGEGLPPYLGAMVATLLAENTEKRNVPQQVRYESAQDVYDDLKVLIATQSVSDGRSVSFKETEIDHGVIIHSRLKLPKDLFYGRQVQMSMIMHLLQSVSMLGDQPLMALIAGYPGTGKSTLVNQIKKPLAERNGCFIEGKFNISARPDKVLASALNSFFAAINASNAGENKFMSMRWRISDAIGSGVSYLYDTIPSLREFMNDGTEVDRSERQKSAGNLLDQRLKYMFCKLISAIPCRSQPLVLVLDDLQWADEMTLGIIRMLMTDPDIHHFLFLGCYRENEVNESHMLSANLNDIRERGVNFTTIKVGPIEKEITNALLSDVMCLPPSLCRPLSNVVHRKTGGIIMFVLRLLASLNDEGLVWYSINARRWMFDLHKIDMKEMPEDVVKHMMEHMGRLPGKIQMGLKLCACLGPSFDATLLEKARKSANISGDFMEACIENGFLQVEGDSTYKWAHDQVQQAAYGLINLQQREKFHLLIGSRLLLSAQPAEIERFIFHIVDNVNMGVNLLENGEQKYEVAELNFKAGEKVLLQQSFHSAVKYLLTGISLLDDDSWGVRYSLTLRLYDAASQALCVTGDYSTLTALAEKPLLYARSFEDKLNTYSNLVRALSSSGNSDECIDTCVSVLLQLGEILPTNVTPQTYLEEVAQVRQALNGLSRQDLLSLPVMTDLRKLTAMRFLNHMLIVTYTANPPLNPIVVFRMVRMTVEFGVCNISAIAFSCYGAWLASGLNDDYDAAFTMGRVTSDLMRKLGSTEVLPRVYILIYGMINIYKEPWQAALCKHSEAYEAGLMHGDTEYALSTLVSTIFQRFSVVGSTYWNQAKV